MIRKALILCFLAITALSVSAQETPVRTGTTEPAALIGMDLVTAFRDFGPPAEVYAVRGDAAEYDDVVFFYESFLYLYWYRNRVWQVRCDQRYAGDVNGIRIGMSRSSVVSVLGDPVRTDGGSLYFDLDGRNYPVRMRIVLSDATVEDIYIYRADF